MNGWMDEELGNWTDSSSCGRKVVFTTTTAVPLVRKCAVAYRYDDAVALHCTALHSSTVLYCTVLYVPDPGFHSSYRSYYTTVAVGLIDFL